MLPLHPRYPEMEKVVGTESDAVLDGAKTAAAAAKEMTTQVNLLLKGYQLGSRFSVGGRWLARRRAPTHNASPEPCRSSCCRTGTQAQGRQGTMSGGMRGTRRREALHRGAALLGVGAVGAACAPGGAGGGERIAQGQSTREVALRWSTWGDSQNTFNSVGAPQGVKLFNEKFPRIKVEIEPQLAGWEVKNFTEWVAGTGPDISGHCCNWGPQWARDGLLFNMEPGLKKDVPDAVRGTSWSG